MELTQLQYFLCSAKCGQVTRAAEILHVSQSTISMAIARLERELGYKLFERTGRSIRLTPEGDRFCIRITPAMAQLDNAYSHMSLGYAERPVTVHLSVEMPALTAKLIDLYAQVQPDCAFRQRLDDRETAEARLVCGFVDFCISYEPIARPEIATEVLFSQRVQALLPSSHPLWKREGLHLEELRDTPFISMNSAYSYRKWVDGLCRMSGFTPKVSLEMCDMQGIIEMLPMKKGAALIGESSSDMFLSTTPYAAVSDNFVRAIPIIDGYCSQTVYISQHKNKPLTQEAQHFLDYIRTVREAAIRLGRIPSAEDMVDYLSA